MNKILKYGLIGLISGLSFINSGCKKAPEYNIDEKTILDKRGGEPAFYNEGLIVTNNTWTIYVPVINSIRITNNFNLARDEIYSLSNQTHEDSVVIAKAQEKINYFLPKVDSMKKVNRDEVTRINYEKDSIKKAKRLKKGLEALD